MILLIILGCISCDIINPPETIPARIQLNAPDLQMQPGQGSALHKITEMWVYGGDNLLGAFAPPVEIHHTTDAALTTFIFKPGIRNNGILDDAIVYPLLTEYVVELNTTPGTLSVVNPVIRYKPEAVFSLISDFEEQNDFLDNRDNNPQSNLVRSSVDPFEGGYSGEILLSAIADTIEVSHAFPLGDLPTDGRPAYLEFHYKSEVQLDIGLLGIPLSGPSASSFFYGVRANEAWNKIYVELTDYLVASELPSYKILFRAIYPPNSTTPTYKIQIDNIKVVHL